jgi:hypothetical protein
MSLRETPGPEQKGISGGVSHGKPPLLGSSRSVQKSRSWFVGTQPDEGGSGFVMATLERMNNSWKNLS